MHKMVQPRYELFFLSVVLALAVLCRLYQFDRGLGHDELYTAVHFVEADSLWKALSSSAGFNNHVGYSIMARVSQAILGSSEWALRLPALLLGLLSILALFVFSRSILGHALALLASFMLAFSPPHIQWSVEARGYSALIFFSILSSYSYFKLLDHPNRRDAFFFIVVSVLGIFVHLYGALVTIVQILFLIRAGVVQRVGKRLDPFISKASLRILSISFLAVVALALILYIPVIRSMLHDVVTRGRSDFDPTFPWAVIQKLSGSERPQIVVPVLLVSVCGWLSLLRSRPQQAIYFAWLLTGPLLIMWLARPFDLVPRFFAYWLPYYIILFTAGLRALWHVASSGNLRLVASSARLLSAVILAAVLYYWSTTSLVLIPDDGYREVSRAVVTDADPSIAFCAIGGNRSLWQYYIKKPIMSPASVTELQEIARTHAEVRCVYYKASWQSAEQTEIAQFLFHHASWSRVKKLTWFVYRTAGADRSAMNRSVDP